MTKCIYLWHGKRNAASPFTLPKESFFHGETNEAFQHLEEISQRSSISRAAAFEDFLSASVCALGHPLMEDEYLQTIERHKEGKVGKRGVDSLARMFATVVATTDKTRADIIGDLFQGSITYGEKGQFLTPEPICEMMATMNLPEEKTGLEGRRTVNDPCCGSGRMLLAAAKIQPNWQFVGQDVDLRCVQMTAINLALRNHYGHVVHGNSLSNKSDQIYETGRVQIWGNAIRKTSRVPLPDREPQPLEMAIPKDSDDRKPILQEPSLTRHEQPPNDAGNSQQLELF